MAHQEREEESERRVHDGGTRYGSVETERGRVERPPSRCSSGGSPSPDGHAFGPLTSFIKRVMRNRMTLRHSRLKFLLLHKKTKPSPNQVFQINRVFFLIS